MKKVIIPVIKKVILYHYYIERDLKTKEIVSTGKCSPTHALIEPPWKRSPTRFEEITEAEYKNALAFGVPESSFGVNGYEHPKEKGA